MRKTVFIFTFLAMLLLIAPNAYAWGQLGHQVVCDIAWRESSSALKRQLSNIARQMGYKTFAESCTWADQIKRYSRYDDLKPLHYLNVDRSQRQVKNASCLRRSQASKPRCVITAILQLQQQFEKNTKKNVLSHEQTIVFLAHLVGDLHQPLHISYADDWGGTKYKVVFNGKLQSLHRLWDTGLLYCQLDSLGRSSISWRHLGKTLHQSALRPSIQQGQVSEKIGLPAVVSWADESLSITRDIYAQLDSKYLPKSYCDQFYPIAMERLRLAGYRLATLLAQTLEP